MAGIRIEDLEKALENTLGQKGMDEKEIKRLAEYVMNFFGFENEIIDNKLSPSDRDVFYMLEEEGILGTREEELHIIRGKLWRIHYWVLNNDRIFALAHKKLVEPKKDDASAIYDKIFEQISKDEESKQNDS